MLHTYDDRHPRHSSHHETSFLFPSRIIVKRCLSSWSRRPPRLTQSSCCIHRDSRADAKKRGWGTLESSGGLRCSFSSLHFNDLTIELIEDAKGGLNNITTIEFLTKTRVMLLAISRSIGEEGRKLVARLLYGEHCLPLKWINKLIRNPDKFVYYLFNKNIKLKISFRVIELVEE